MNDTVLPPVHARWVALNGTVLPPIHARRVALNEASLNLAPPKHTPQGPEPIERGGRRARARSKGTRGLPVAHLQQPLGLDPLGLLLRDRLATKEAARLVEVGGKAKADLLQRVGVVDVMP